MSGKRSDQNPRSGSSVLSDWISGWTNGKVDFRIQLQNLAINWDKILNKPSVFPNDQQIISRQFILDSSTFTSLNSHPIELITQVTDKVIIPLDVTIINFFRTIPYLSGGNLELYGDQLGSHIYGVANPAAYTSSIRPDCYKMELTPQQFLPITSSLYLKTADSDPRDGDGDVVVNVMYRLVDTVL